MPGISGASKFVWSTEADQQQQLGKLQAKLEAPSIVLVEVSGGCPRPPRNWDVSPLTSARGISLCFCRGGTLWGAPLDVAACCDFLFLNRGVKLDLGGAETLPSWPTIHLFSRGGRRALARVLLDPSPVDAKEAEELGIATVADPKVFLKRPISLGALIALRDLLRSSSAKAARLALEKAAFSLLIASGEAAEGAAAFLEKRQPSFFWEASGREDSR